MRLKGLEPITFGSVDQRSIQLSYKRARHLTGASVDVAIIAGLAIAIKRKTLHPSVNISKSSESGLHTPPGSN